MTLRAIKWHYCQKLKWILTSTSPRKWLIIEKMSVTSVFNAMHRRSVVIPALSSAEKQKLNNPDWSAVGFQTHIVSPRITLLHFMPIGELYWNRVMEPFGVRAFSLILMTPLTMMVVPAAGDGSINFGFRAQYDGRSLRLLRIWSSWSIMLSWSSSSSGRNEVGYLKICPLKVLKYRGIH